MVVKTWCDSRKDHADTPQIPTVSCPSTSGGLPSRTIGPVAIATREDTYSRQHPQEVVARRTCRGSWNERKPFLQSVPQFRRNSAISVSDRIEGRAREEDADRLADAAFRNRGGCWL